MVRLLVAGLILGALLAGCAGTPGPTSSSDAARFDDLQGQATETTGIIRGVVVDTAVTPIAKATVLVSGPVKQNLTTDAQGRFLAQGLPAGTYLVKAKAPLYVEAQTTAEVVAGVSDPAVTKVQLQRLFSQKPFVQADHKRGYFDCSQNGAGIYSSSNCVTDQCPLVLDPATCNSLPTRMMDNITTQSREWHMDVGPGWQNIVLEMQWTQATAGTGSTLGMVVSTFKPLRNPAHSFANVAGTSPFLLRLDVGVKHPTAASVEPTMIPAEGMNQVSYFVSARRDAGSPLPGIAFQQNFDVYYHQFYYGLAPTDWSFLKGDKAPF